MNKKDVLEKIELVFQDVFDNINIKITETTVAEDIEEWDSLAHVQLVHELEKVFCIRLSSQELMSWDNVGEMIDSILSKIS